MKQDPGGQSLKERASLPATVGPTPELLEATGPDLLTRNGKTTSYNKGF